MARRRPPNPYDRHRREAYDRVAGRNQDRIPDLREVDEELRRLVDDEERLRHLSALDDAARWQAVVDEDEARTSPANGQAPLPGWPDAEDRFWKLDEGERVRVAAATAEDHFRHVELVDENASRVAAAASAVRRDYYRLTPYYLKGARTVAAAAAAWQRDNP